MKKQSFENKTTEKKSFIPKSLPVINMMKLGRLIQNKERNYAEILIEKFYIENNNQHQSA